MKQTNHRATLFLTELVIDLFIFIVSAAVCVGLLVNAHGMSRESTHLTESVYIAQTAAELCRAGRTPGAYYRADGTACASAEAAYFVDVFEAEQVAGQRLPAVVVNVYPMDGDRDAPCYSLTVKLTGEVARP